MTDFRLDRHCVFIGWDSGGEAGSPPVGHIPSD
jgi:hypothetical protein